MSVYTNEQLRFKEASGSCYGKVVMKGTAAVLIPDYNRTNTFNDKEEQRKRAKCTSAAMYGSSVVKPIKIKEPTKILEMNDAELYQFYLDSKEAAEHDPE